MLGETKKRQDRVTKGNDGVARPILYSFPSLLGFLSGTDDEEGRIDRANPILVSVSRPALSLSFARLRERHDARLFYLLLAWHGRTKRGRYLSRLQESLEMPGKPEVRETQRPLNIPASGRYQSLYSSRCICKTLNSQRPQESPILRVSAGQVGSSFCNSCVPKLSVSNPLLLQAPADVLMSNATPESPPRLMGSIHRVSKDQRRSARHSDVKPRGQIPVL